jgi:hypothetical protein
MTKYRVYLAPDGSDLSYCGECKTFKQAAAFAKTRPIGIEKCMWDSYRACNHHHAVPDPAGVEQDDPWYWVDDYCVVRTEY